MDTWLPAGETGFDDFISLETFTDASMGYLVDDTCEFGAEVYVSKERRRGVECLSMIKDAVTHKLEWKVDNFSKLNAKSIVSELFGDDGAQRFMWYFYAFSLIEWFGCLSIKLAFLAI